MHKVRYEEIREDGKLNTTIASEFSENHPMFKKYGVREMVASGYCDGKPEFYTLRADVFGKSVDFRARPQIFSEAKPNEVVAAFLKRLSRAVNYKQTPFLENLVEIAQHIKK